MAALEPASHSTVSVRNVSEFQSVFCIAKRVYITLSYTIALFVFAGKRFFVRFSVEFVLQPTKQWLVAGMLTRVLALLMAMHCVAALEHTSWAGIRILFAHRTYLVNITIW